MVNSPTVYDIARELSVSVSTVSRALNNSVLVSEETRRSVLRTAQKLGYQSRGIKRHRSRTILNVLLLIPYRADTRLHTFYDPADLIVGLKAGFGETRVNIIIEPANSASVSLTHKKSGDIDAVVCGFMLPPAEIRDAAEHRGIPLVSLNRVGECDYVSCDNYGGMLVLVDRIMEAEFEQPPVFVLPESVPEWVARERVRGFEAGCRKHGIDTSSAVIRVNGLESFTEALAERILTGGPRGIMCFNDIAAVTFLHAAAGIGAVPPEDYGLTGFDNSPVQTVLRKRIDTVDLSVHEIGEAAGRWIFTRVIERHDVGERLNLLLPVRYVRGDTVPHDGMTGCPRNRDRSMG